MSCMLTAEFTVSQNVNINTATGKLRLAAIPAQRIFNGFDLSQQIGQRLFRFRYCHEIQKVVTFKTDRFAFVNR